MPTFSILNGRNQPTGLPLVLNFTVPPGFGASQLMAVSGSAFTGQPGGNLMTVQILIEDQVIGSMFFFSNAPGTHRAFAPVFIPQSLVPGSTYTLTLRELDNSPTVTDFNDWFSVALIS